MNRTGKTTAQVIDKNYNEYKEFNDRGVEAHICVAFMRTSDMVTMECEYTYLMWENDIRFKCRLKLWLKCWLKCCLHVGFSCA